MNKWPKKHFKIVAVWLCMLAGCAFGFSSGTVCAEGTRESIQTDDAGEITVTKELELSLEYNDRCILTDELKDDLSGQEWEILDILNESTESYQVKNGKKTEEKDSHVIGRIGESGTEIMAEGTGSAEIFLVPAGELEKEPVNVVRIDVKVKPAVLTVMYLAGQSNAEGWCSKTASGYRIDQSVACPSGEVYSTYLPSTVQKANAITGLNFSNVCTEKNVPDFVAGSLTDDESISGKELEYPLDSLTENGSGKTGPDSGLAYEWNRLTGEKVWVVNTAWGSTSIKRWIPGQTYYERAAAAGRLVRQTFQAEVDAGHYIEGSSLLFWLQGEQDYAMDAEDYYSYFKSMQGSLTSELGLDRFGIIMTRSSEGSYANKEDISMSGPRAVQYGAGGAEGLSGVYVVSNVNEQWVTDAGVYDYFLNAYKDAWCLDYPMHGGKNNLPSSVDEVHGDIHYSQVGHNENGITAARGMYAGVNGNTEKPKAVWKDRKGRTVSSLTVDADEEQTVVCVTDPSYSGKQVHCAVDGSAVSYDPDTGKIRVNKSGKAVLKALDAQGNVLAELKITATDTSDMSGIAGSSYTGLYKYNGTWYYLKNGRIQKNCTSVVKNDKGWWYVEDGTVDFTYNGFAENSNGWWYIEKGKVTFKKTDVIKGTVNGEKAWWRVVKSEVDFGCNSVEKNKNGWWYIRDGKVDFDYTGVAKNRNGWWRIEDGKVNFGYTGFGENSNGWWYLEKGKVTFKKTDVIKGTVNGEKAWWRVAKSEVDFGWNGVAKNKNGTWLIEDGKVNFSFSGNKTFNGIKYTIKNGKCL